MNAYKFGFPGPASTSYCGPYEVNDHLPRVDVSRMVWEYPSVMNTEELPATDSQLGEEEASGVGTTEECWSKLFFFNENSYNYELN